MLRVVSDNDAVPEAAAPAQDIITDLPLDPNFIDDSDADDRSEPEQDDVVPPSPDEAN